MQPVAGFAFDNLQQRRYAGVCQNLVPFLVQGKFLALEFRLAFEDFEGQPVAVV